MVNSQRKYICSFCAKSFSRSEHRTRHERSHTGYKPFQCKICKHSFVRRDLVQRHIRTVHRILLLANRKDIDNSNINKDGSTTTTTKKFTFVNNDNNSSDLEDSTWKLNSTKQRKSKRDTSTINSESTDDQILDDIVSQMIRIKELPKGERKDSENTKKMKTNSSNNGNKNNSNIFINKSAEGNKSKSNFSNIISKSDEDDKLMIKNIYLNPINDFYNSYLTSTVINRFHISYYSDQLIQNFNAGICSLESEHLFLNSILNIFKNSGYDNDKFFNKIWFSENENFLPILGITISCLGNLKKNNVNDQNLWVLCWNQSMKFATDFGKPDILSISLLIHILLKTIQSEKTSSDVLQFFQQSLLCIINQLDNSQSPVDSIDIKSFDIWNIFDIWVSLTKITDIFNAASSTIYKWFLKQNNLFSRFPELTLYDFLNSRNYVIDEHLSVATLNILPDTLYCEANNTLFNISRNNYSIGSFKSTEELHNLIIKINQKFSNLTMKNIISEMTSNNIMIGQNNGNPINIHDPNYNFTFQDWKKNVLLLRSPSKFTNLLIDYTILPHSNNHWLLWESTWFEFLKKLSPAELLYKKVSFIHLQSLQNVYLEHSMINNNLALCAIPVIALVENNAKHEELFPINTNFVSLIVDIMLFQLKFFSTDLVPSPINGPTHILGFLSNPIVQLLFYVWYSIIYKGDVESNNISSFESDSVVNFMEKYIINSEQNLDIDKLLEEDINEILFNNKSSSFVGFHLLVESIGNYIKNEIIIKRLFPLPSIDQEQRFKLFEFFKIFEKEEVEPKFINNNNAMTNNSNLFPHRPSISSIGSNNFNLATSPTLYTPGSRRRRSSVISITEDGQKLLLPPLNFVPGQVLSSPPSKRNSISNNNLMESSNTKISFAHYNDNAYSGQTPMQGNQTNNFNNLTDYSYDGTSGDPNSNNRNNLTKFNPKSLLASYDDDTRRPMKWLHERRSSFPSIFTDKTITTAILPPIPIITSPSFNNSYRNGGLPKTDDCNNQG